MDPLSIILFLVLFALSALFAWSEIALMSIPHHKIESFIKQRKYWAKSLKKIKSNSDRLLITILVWNNLVNVSVASLATKISIDIANASWIEQWLAIGISTWIITLLLLFFWDMFPKSIAIRYTDSISLYVAKFYVILEKILYPIIIVVEYIMNLFQKEQKKQHIITDEEIESFMEMSHKAWTFEKGEYEKIKNMLDFYEITAQEIMTPRIKMEAIPDTMTVSKAKEKIMKFSHSRIPVYQESIDTIDCFVTLRELLIAEKKWYEDKKLKELDLPDILKVPLTKPIHLILDQFKKSRSHIAAVIDEYGGIAGLLTLEDVVEEVFGDIMDETDKETLAIKKEWLAYIFQSHITMDEFLEKIGLQFYELDISEKEFSWETLSYFITSYLERFPKVGEEILFLIKQDDNLPTKQLRLKVLSLEKNTIGEIKTEIVQLSH
jgi:putative hemolysin